MSLRDFEPICCLYWIAVIPGKVSDLPRTMVLTPELPFIPWNDCLAGIFIKWEWVRGNHIYIDETALATIRCGDAFDKHNVLKSLTATEALKGWISFLDF